MTVGGADSMLLTTTNAGLPVTFTNNTPQICTITGGIEHAITSGVCSVTVSAPGNGLYAPYSQIFTANISVVDVITVIGYPILHSGWSGNLAGSAVSLSGSPIFYEVTSSPASQCYMYGPTNLKVVATGGVCVVTALVQGTEPIGFVSSIAITYIPILNP
jgi:hypothetical protein